MTTAPDSNLRSVTEIGKQFGLTDVQVELYKSLGALRTTTVAGKTLMDPTQAEHFRIVAALHEAGIEVVKAGDYAEQMQTGNPDAFRFTKVGIKVLLAIDTESGVVEIPEDVIPTQETGTNR